MRQNRTTLQFGRKRAKPPKENSEKTANIALISGIITISVFFFCTLTGASLSHDGTQAESALRPNAVPVMSTVDPDCAETDRGDVKEIIRKSIRDASAEPFGYLNGQWNLWEYLGDVMADMLLGG